MFGTIGIALRRGHRDGPERAGLDLALHGLDQLDHHLHVARRSTPASTAGVTCRERAACRGRRSASCSSPAKCWVVPTPGLPKLSLPGLALTCGDRRPSSPWPGKSGARHQHEAGGADHRHHLEVVDRVVAQRLVHRRRRRRARCSSSARCSRPSAPSRPLRRGRAAGADAVLDHDRLAERLRTAARPTMRAAMSVPPPAPKPTTMLIGRRRPVLRLQRMHAVR